MLLLVPELEVPEDPVELAQTLQAHPCGQPPVGADGVMFEPNDTEADESLVLDASDIPEIEDLYDDELACEYRFELERARWGWD